MLTTANLSGLKGRGELGNLFRNGSKLSSQHFAALIYSTLNKRDDQFYGVWQAGQTYRKGDVVYYDRALWEMKGTGEICGREEEAPGKDPQWTCRIKDLEDKVTLLNQELDKTKENLDSLQKEFDSFKQLVTRFISLLTLGFGFVFLWLLLSAISHLI